MKLLTLWITFLGILCMGFIPGNVQNRAQTGEFDDLTKTFDSLRVKNLDAVIPFLDSVYQVFTISRNERGRGVVLLKMGDIYQQKAHFPAAYEAYEEALNIFRTLDDELNAAHAYSGLGTVEGRQGNMTVASEHLVMALEIFERFNHDRGIGGIFIKLGLVNVLLGNYDMGIEYYNKALPFALKTDTHNVITIYNNIGGAYLYQDSVEKSIPFFEKALSFAQGEEFEEAQTLALSNLALTSNKMGNKAEAIRYYDRAITLAKKHQLQEQVLLIKNNKINIFAENNPAQAITELKEVFREADSLKLYSIALAAANQLVDLYKDAGNDKDVIQWLEKKLRVSGVMYDESKAREVAEVQSLYELNKSRASIMELQEKIELREKATLYFWAAISVLVIGLIVAFVMNRRNRQINRTLKVREAELEEKDRVKDRLFSIIGHDIKGGFSTQSIILELLEKQCKEGPEETVELIGGMRNNLNEVNHILDTLLHWGKVQIGGVYLNQKLFRINDTVQTVFEHFSVSITLKNQSLINQVPPDTYIFADQDHFNFILRNLLSNAIKYSYEGGEITVGMSGSSRSGTTIIYIHDEGVGIPDEVKDQVFKPFNQSQQGTNNELGNSLALMICKEFMELNRGRIWFENNEGPGVTFFIAFPDQIPAE